MSIPKRIKIVDGVVYKEVTNPSKGQEKKITEDQYLKFGGHCFESTGMVLTSIPPQYPEVCKHCGKRRVGTPQSSMRYD